MPLYLPVSASTIEQIFGGNASDLADTLSTPELAATLVLMKVARAGAPDADTLEKLLASVISAANESIGAGANPLRNLFLRDLDTTLLQQVVSQMDGDTMVLMEPPEVKSRKYLDAHGSWDFGYRKRRSEASPLIRDPIKGYPKSVSMTDAQLRVTECLLLNDNEPLHVQGYAGTGKTHLLVNILNVLQPPNNPLVLCHTQQQVRAIRLRLPQTHATLLTFQLLALEVLDQPGRLEAYAFGYARPSMQRMSNEAQMSDAQLAGYMAFSPVGSLSASSVANMCRRMIMSFCHGPAEFISPVTIPRGFQLSGAEQALLVQYATDLWRETLQPTRGIDIPIRAYHLIKLMALSGFGIPGHYTHVIVDESHDLSAPMLQVLERSTQAFITLGDDLQSLSGHVRRHSATVRSRAIGQAVRAGEAMESVLTPLIQAHPLSPSEPYKGNRSIGTVISHYDSLQLPANPTTILVKDLWGLLEWFLRLSPEGSGCGFEVLGNRRQFALFAHDLVDLFNQGRRPRHGLLFRYTRWDKLYEAETAAGNKAMERIARRLEKGLTKPDLEQLLSRTGNDTSTGWRLGLVSEVRNREFDTVMLTPDLLPQPKSMTANERGKLLTAIYTGASRARHEIIVPGYLTDWVTDLTRLAD